MIGLTKNSDMLERWIMIGLTENPDMLERWIMIGLTENPDMLECWIMTGLTENSDMLERWIMTGPEISRVVEEFTGANDNDDDEELPHHEDGCTPHRIRQWSSFKFKGKQYCCKLMQEDPSLMEEFVTIVESLFQKSPRLIEVATNFGCRLYSNESNEDNGVEGVLTED